MKALIVYHSYRQITTKLVLELSKAIQSEGGEALCKQADESNVEDLLGINYLVLACGQPFGTIPGPVKAFLERCWEADKKKETAGLSYTTIINGKRDTKASISEIDKIADLFNWQRFNSGITMFGTDFDINEALVRCGKLGKILCQITY